MQPLVQSAIQAIQRGDKRTALDLLQQALALDPKDVEALLTLAPLVEEHTRKRQVWNRLTKWRERLYWKWTGRRWAPIVLPPFPRLLRFPQPSRPLPPPNRRVTQPRNPWSFDIPLSGW